MKAKRIIAAVLAFFALASFAGCKSEKKEPVTPTLTEASEIEVSETQTDAASETQSSAVKTILATNVKDKTKYVLERELYFFNYADISYGHWFIIEIKSDSTEYIERMKAAYDSHGNFKSYASYTANGKILSDEENKYIYNTDGTIKSYTNYSEGKALKSISFEYDNKKRTTKITYRALGKERDGLPVVLCNTIFYDDSAGTKTTKNLEDMYGTGNFVLTSEIIEKYDSKDNLIEERFLDYTDNQGANEANIKSYKYDEYGRCISTRYSDGAEDLNTFDSHGNILISECKDYSGTTTNITKYEYEYDKNGRPTKEHSSFVDRLSGKTYTYETIAVNDAFGNPTNIKRYGYEGTEKKILTDEQKISYVYEENRITMSVDTIDYTRSLSYKYTCICEYHQTLPAVERLP